MGKGGRLRCKNSGAVERQLGRELAPYSQGTTFVSLQCCNCGGGIGRFCHLVPKRRSTAQGSFAQSVCSDRLWKQQVYCRRQNRCRDDRWKNTRLPAERVYIFKGVPYGAGTAGKKRFRPPASPEPWTGIRSALQGSATRCSTNLISQLLSRLSKKPRMSASST